MAAADLEQKTGIELDQMIANYETKQATGMPLYRQLLEERARRSQVSQHLNFDRSIEHLRQAALNHVCTTYGALAEASGVEWSKARRQMDGAAGHLSRVSELCFSKKLPFLTALCVNQRDVAAGELKGEALSGFIACARRLGFLVTDEEAFHRERRDECWRWGQAQAGP